MMRPLLVLLIVLTVSAWAEPTTYSYHLRHLTPPELIGWLQLLVPECKVTLVTPRRVSITSDEPDLPQLLEELDSPPAHRLASRLVVLDEVGSAGLGLPLAPKTLETQSIGRFMCNVPSLEQRLSALVEAGHAKLVGTSPPAKSVELQVEGLRLSASLDQRGCFYVTRKAFGQRPRYRARRIVAPDMLFYCGDLSVFKPEARSTLGLAGRCQVWLAVGWSCWNCRHPYPDRNFTIRTQPTSGRKTRVEPRTEATAIRGGAASPR